MFKHNNKVPKEMIGKKMAGAFDQQKQPTQKEIEDLKKKVKPTNKKK